MPFISMLRCSNHSSTLSDTGTGLFRVTCALCPTVHRFIGTYNESVNGAVEDPFIEINQLTSC